MASSVGPRDHTTNPPPASPVLVFPIALWFPRAGRLQASSPRLPNVPPAWASVLPGGLLERGRRSCRCCRGGALVSPLHLGKPCRVWLVACGWCVEREQETGLYLLGEVGRAPVNARTHCPKESLLQISRHLDRKCKCARGKRA